MFLFPFLDHSTRHAPVQQDLRMAPLFMIDQRQLLDSETACVSSIETMFWRLTAIRCGR